MRVGVPKEIKNREYRVGLTPPSVAELVPRAMRSSSSTERGAARFQRPDYEKVGARIVDNAGDVFAAAELIVKVKELQPQEVALLERRHILFAYLHLAADPAQAEGLMKSGATCIAYETVTSRGGVLPLLKPMSEVAGRMSIQVGAHYLEKEQGGRGVLLGGVPGVAPAHVAILGGGVAGLMRRRWRSASAPTSPLDINNDRLAELDTISAARSRRSMPSMGRCRRRSPMPIRDRAVLVPAGGPKLVTRAMLKTDEAGSVGSISPSTMAAASKPRVRPPTTIRCSKRMAGSIIASQYAGRGGRTSAFALNNAPCRAS